METFDDQAFRDQTAKEGLKDRPNDSEQEETKKSFINIPVFEKFKKETLARWKKEEGGDKAEGAK